MFNQYITIMENTIVKEAPANTTKEKWCEENVLKLAHHFHKFNGKTHQFDRVTHFTMNEKQLNDFRGISEIKTAHIYMALNNDSKNEISFLPYLSINWQEKKKEFAKEYLLTPQTDGNFWPEEENGQSISSDQVPAVFRNMVWENWATLEMHLIDDLFHCKNRYGFLVRVECFEITRNMVAIIDQLKTSATGITLYPGIDLNKFNKPNKISFTPVLGINVTGVDAGAIVGKGHLGLLESNNAEMLFEYSSPCPPTCIPPSL